MNENILYEKKRNRNAFVVFHQTDESDLVVDVGEILLRLVS